MTRDACEWRTEVRDIRFIFFQQFETLTRVLDNCFELFIEIVGNRGYCLSFVGSISCLGQFRLSASENFFGRMVLDRQSGNPRGHLG